jgi:hypothetical protein
MRYPTRLVICLLAAGAAALPWQSRAQDPKKIDPPAAKEPTVMQRKLAHAQGVLTGLALSDFDKIDKEADALIRVRQEVTWKLNETEAYLRQSLAFLENLQDMKKAAKAKNLDGATMAYLEMTRTCVKCHETLRTLRRAKGED